MSIPFFHTQKGNPKNQPFSITQHMKTTYRSASLTLHHLPYILTHHQWLKLRVNHHHKLHRPTPVTAGHRNPNHHCPKTHHGLTSTLMIPPMPKPSANQHHHQTLYTPTLPDFSPANVYRSYTQSDRPNLLEIVTGSRLRLTLRRPGPVNHSKPHVHQPPTLAGTPTPNLTSIFHRR